MCGDCTVMGVGCIFASTNLQVGKCAVLYCWCLHTQPFAGNQVH
jgi:hypothetical protein